MLDEFCNLPKIPDIPAMISAARSRNMRFFLVAQSMHQLKGRYQEDADTIKGNCENWVFLTSRELDLLEEVSKLCGSMTTFEGASRRLISVSELQRLNKQKGEALIFHARLYPFISQIADIDDYEAFRGYAPLPVKKGEKPEYHIFSVEKLYNDLLEGKARIPFPKQGEE